MNELQYKKYICSAALFNFIPMDDETFLKFYNEPKVIDGDLTWKHVGEGRLVIKDTVIISNALHDKEIKLYCRQNILNDFAFNIVYHGYGEDKIELVRYDKSPHPPNFIDKCTGINIREPHKHKFKVGFPNGCRKVIPNSEINRTDVNKALFQFFDECNITLNGEYETLSKIQFQSLLHDYITTEGKDYE